jgi:hypothetical protein
VTTGVEKIEIVEKVKPTRAAVKCRYFSNSENF